MPLPGARTLWPSCTSRLEDGMVRQFLWNQAAVIKCGLEGVGVGLRYPEESVALTWQGVPWNDLSKKKELKKKHTG